VEVERDLAEGRAGPGDPASEPAWHPKGSLPPGRRGKICAATVFGRRVWYRNGTADVNCLQEVLFRRCYRRERLGFDVLPGEHWLDLGANVGAFAVYCLIRGATAECYEPDPSCYGLLVKNAVGCRTFCAAVTASREPTVPFRVQAAALNGLDFTRGAVSTRKVAGTRTILVPNVWAGSLAGEYDGVKMDVEGAEHAILDAGVLPPCRKLVVEYHLSRDSSLAHLGRRLDWLKGRFAQVVYPRELDRLVARGGLGRTYYDRQIFCVR
jgi:FkbM family methyltransferase